MNIDEFRRQIAELLAEQLGTYTLENGATTPALTVAHTGDSLADLPTTGLEVIIRAVPESEKAVVTYGQNQPQQTWQLFLRQWHGPNTITAAKHALEAAYLGTTCITLKIPKDKDFRELISVKIHNEMAI
jgi:hypothetical protein